MGAKTIGSLMQRLRMPVTASEIGNPVQIKLTGRTPAACPGRSSGPKCLIETKSTLAQLLV
jgi:hypothetical protein